VVSARRSPSALWGRCPAVVGRVLSRRVDWTLGADCMVSSVAGCNSDGYFPVGTPEGARLRIPQEYRRSRCKTSCHAAVTAIDANVLRRVPESAVRQYYYGPLTTKR
jgi:hypothetical protein